MLSKFRNATDKARKLVIEHRNCSLPFILCFRNHINMFKLYMNSAKRHLHPREHLLLPVPSRNSALFWMCIFCFPTSSVIPLHDHPSMTVFSKVLYGSLHVKAYDWVEPACYSKNKGPGYPTVRLAKLTVDKILTAPCETSVLYPKRGGNLHCFTAVSPCAVLDILTPPYRENAGRKCTYYHDYPFTTFSRGNGAEIDDEKIDEHAWLAEIDTPDDLYMRQGDYTGPAVQV
uniref:cysteine dioxygenase n=1 Tax=Salix viminalis TaxID=40686 RepID=A0A6N2LGV7_SALVM